MNQNVINDLSRRIDAVRRRSARLRYGRVSTASPLAVKLGNADIEYANVKSLVTGLIVDDHVAVLVQGNDCLVLGKVV